MDIVMTEKELAVKIASIVHKDQVDKGGAPYIEHCLAVASQMPNDKLQVCAVLHDVLEDTEFPEKAIEMLFGNEVFEVLKILKHEKNIPYESYIECVAENQMASVIKMADLKHNMDLTRLKEVSDKDLQRIKKYKKAYKFLKNKWW